MDSKYIQRETSEEIKQPQMLDKRIEKMNIKINIHKTKTQSFENRETRILKQKQEKIKKNIKWKA